MGGVQKTTRNAPPAPGLLVRVQPEATPGYPRYFGLNAYDNVISHSLAMDVVWAAAFALVYFTWRSDLRGAITLAAAVFSHWVFDFITHRPDMPLAPGVEVKVGLTLWNSIIGTFKAVSGRLLSPSTCERHGR